MALELFPKDQIVGVFRGFQQGGLEFHADLVLPYRSDFQSIPMHGQFLLVQLESPIEAVIGRITSLSSDGKLSFGSGEEFNLRALKESRPIPEDLREEYLKYRVNIRVLGVCRVIDGQLNFVASHRRLPHVGSPVAFPSGQVLQELAGHNMPGAEIGHLAFGEYVFYGDASSRPGSAVDQQSWMQVRSPEIKVKFPVEKLVARRTFVFARAGFGKSNLNKLLFSELYRVTPTTRKRGDRLVPVGTIIFDPDGEYFWPDDNGRPGLCDVPHLQDQLVVFTARHAPSSFYGSFVVGGIKLDIRSLRPGDVIAIALDAEKQNQQNVTKLRSLAPDRWAQLVDLIDQSMNDTLLEDVCDLLRLNPSTQEAEALAARANMTAIVRMLHDKSSRTMDVLLTALAEGKLCVIDVSQMRGQQALVLSGLILRKIFSKNQEEFTNAVPATIPTIAVIEEAQSVLHDSSAASEPYVAWVKEGRKYDLGALLITQQPGSIPNELLSQGDNWFIFHLLSAGDLSAVKKANAHFSDDLLSSLLNEPIPGNGIFWSSVGGKAYPIPMRVVSFEKMYERRDQDYKKPECETYAARLRLRFRKEMEQFAAGMAAAKAEGLAQNINELPFDGLESDDLRLGSEDRLSVDTRAASKTLAIRAFQSDSDLLRRLRSPKGAPWRAVIESLAKGLPETMVERRDFSAQLVVEALNSVFGDKPKGWTTGKNERGVLYVFATEH